MFLKISSCFFAENAPSTSISDIKPSLDWLENPEVFRVNRVDAHSDHWFYEKIARA